MGLKNLEFFRTHKKIILVTAILAVILLILLLFYFFIFEKLINKYTNDSKRTGIISVARFNPFDQINDDYKNGKIDYETHLVEKVKYAFGDSKTIGKYKKFVETFEDDGAMNKIVKNYSKLSDKTKKELKPYFKRPTDPNSYLYQKINSIKVAQVSDKKFGLIDIAGANDRPTSSNYGKIFKYIDTADQKIRVWYLYDKSIGDSNSFNKTFLSDAKQVVSDLNKNKVYSKFKELLKEDVISDKNLGGDGKLDIYLDPTNIMLKNIAGQSNAAGLNVPDISGSNFSGSSFIIVDSNTMDDIIKSTVAHEVFHAFQRSFIFDYDKDHWWIEATAVWAENFIYHNLDSEQKWVEDFIPFPNEILNSDSGNKEYGAYVFHLYLYKTYGDVIIQKIFKATEISGGQTIIKTIGSMIPSGNADKIRGFKDFTLWNYNLNPVQYYKLADKSGNFPTDSSGDNVLPLSLVENQALMIKINKTSPLAAQVITIDNFITDKKVNKIEFTNVWSQKADVSKTYAGVKAIIYPKTGNSWVEDWTDKMTRDFCLNKNSSGRNENIKSVTLILSNAGIESDFPAGSFIVEGKKDSKDCQEDKKTKTNFSLNGLDVRATKYGECDWGKPKGAGGDSRTFSITGRFTGKPGVIPEALELYPYMGIWEATYNYNSSNYAKTGSVKFDMSYAFNDLIANVALKQADPKYVMTLPIFEFKPNPYVENHLFSGVWGSLTNITESSATIHINLYDWSWNFDCGSSGPIFDRSDVLMYIK